jgi:glycosyltransferase involved in cell wall biosynthesis
MRVAVDAMAMPSQRAGAGTYITELLVHTDPEAIELHVFAKHVHADDLRALVPHAVVHPIEVTGRASRIAWSSTRLSAHVREIAPDVFFGPHYTLPSRLVCPSVVTFHDPTFFTLPKLHERKKVAYFRRAARAGIKRATRAIAVSEYTRAGAIAKAGARPDRVDVVPEGVDLDRFVPSGGPDASDPYILFLATLEPRKDLPTLIAAYERLDADVRLLIAGQDGWKMRAITDALARATRAGISRLGYVSDDAKVELYQHASVFVYPSIAEGFGLPVLEAMACGTPVVTTTGSAPEEIAADGALLVEPGDVEGLRHAISRVLKERSLQQALRSKGRERAERYTWDAAARATADVWRRAAEDGA